MILLIPSQVLAGSEEEILLRERQVNSPFPNYLGESYTKKDNVIAPNLPNSTFRDYTKPAIVEKDGVYYQTMPKSNFPDYRKPSFKGKGK